jgi:hypothetical protein
MDGQAGDGQEEDWLGFAGGWPRLHWHTLTKME